MSRVRRLLPAGLGLLIGLLVIGPGLAPGFVLSYDMVFVPDPNFTEATFGMTGTVARAVPSDAVVTALAQVLPSDLVQKLVLLTIFVLGCAGVARLVPGIIPGLAAGAFYMWNPYVGERLLLGQWALLLGYAGLPWVMRAACDVARGASVRRLGVALIPAAIGGFAAMIVSAIAMTAILLAVDGKIRERALRAARGLAVAGALSLPWLVPGLLRPGGVPGDPAAVEAFAARADTPFGSVGSLLLLGGAWNAETVPEGYGTLPLILIWAALAIAAGAGWIILARRGLPGLSAAALTGFLVACLGLTPLLRWLVEAWSGFSVLRDGQQYVAPLAVVLAVGFGAVAKWLMGKEERPGGEAPSRAGTDAGAGRVLGVLAVLAPVLVLPSLALGGLGDLRAVDYPADWTKARVIIDGDPAKGEVVVLPWAAYRSYSWNHRRRVLDPMPRFLRREVIWNDAVRVGSREVGTEDPRARELGPAILSGGPLVATLRAEGVRYVVIDDPSAKAAAASRLQGAELVLDGSDLTVYRVPGAERVSRDVLPTWAILIGGFGCILTIIWSVTPTRQ